MLVKAYILKTSDQDGSTLYQCNQCGKTSKVCTNLKDHIEASHIEGLHLECHVCQKYFKSRGRLSFHLKSIHKE